MRRIIPIILAASLFVTGCQRTRNGGTIAVSLIRDPSGNVVLPDLTEEGLVRLDREGQIVPAAAVRWAILDDGLDYIFRIDDTVGLSAATVARRLRDALRRARHDPEVAAMAPVESVQAVTHTVVEIRLTVPQPDLLLLLAQPDYAVGSPAPLRIGKQRGGARLLEPRPGEDAAPILLRGERVGRAVARFAAGEAQLVLGGTFADLAVAQAAHPSRRVLRFDPATGLFGFAIRNAALPTDVRNALSLAIDRDRIVALVGLPGQKKATTIAGSTIEPPLAQRRATALALLAGRQAHVRVAVPRGPGAGLLFALVAQDWAKVGITVDRAPADAHDVDLTLVDRIAPAGTLATLACALSAGCDPRDRLQLINPPFIPVSAPIRWSLVAPELDLFTENALAAHPLDQLRSTH